MVGSFDPVDLVLRQLDLHGRGGIFNMLDPPGADDGGDHAWLLQQPGQADLGAEQAAVLQDAQERIRRGRVPLRGREEVEETRLGLGKFS